MPGLAYLIDCKQGDTDTDKVDIIFILTPGKNSTKHISQSDKETKLFVCFPAGELGKT